MKIAILNTTILTADGNFSLRTISLDEAREMIGGAGDLVGNRASEHGRHPYGAA